MKFSRIILAASLSLALCASQSFAAAKKAPPKGAERKKQFDRVLKECRKSKGGGYQVYVEWGSHYGKTGWWCVYRG